MLSIGMVVDIMLKALQLPDIATLMVQPDELIQFLHCRYCSFDPGITE